MVEAERAWGSLLLAWGVLAVCLAFMVWTLLGAGRKQQWRARWQRLRRPSARPKAAPGSAADPTSAQREADALIARARRAGTVRREGNVLRPERFARREGGAADDPPDDDEPRRPTLH
jgi:hypothetical protein